MDTRSPMVAASVFFLAVSVAPIGAQRTALTDVTLAPEFDAASIRLVASGGDGEERSASRFTPGRFVASRITLRELIRGAYNISVTAQVRGGPAWLDSARFDVQATAPDATPEQMQGMLR